MTARSDLMAAALDYARRGWPVLPLVPGTKVPLGKLVPHGLHDASTDASTALRWWRAEPRAGIGLRTGTKFDVLDVDGAEGWHTLAHLVEESSRPLDCGPVVITPGGGAHYLFKPSGLGNRTRFAPGLDWRGQNGYVVAAPSLHPNGVRYEWVVEPDEEAIPEAPAWLLDLLRRPGAPLPAAARPVPIRGGSTYARAALRDECDAVASTLPGQRNDRLNRAAFAVGQLICAGLLHVEPAADALLAAAMSAGLSEFEAEATIKSGIRGGAQSPRRVAS